ncbi:hypothetical protein BGZ81_009592 [Podila clonocystis]|nr:hypothetical protein BGZ81_009592 [Podila clonocystis]
MYHSTAAALLGKIVLKQFIKAQLATQDRGSTTPTPSTVSGELTTAQLAVSSTLQSIATIQPFNILQTMEVLPPDRPFFIYDYSPPDTKPIRRRRQQQERSNGESKSKTENTSRFLPNATSSPATQANLPSITILTPSTVHQATAALPMTAPPLASLKPSDLGTSLAATTQTLVFPGTGHRSGFLVMLPDSTELVLDFGTLIHGNHPDEDNEDDDLVLVLFEEDEAPSISWTVTIAMPPQTALPSPHRRSPLQQQLHAAASSGLGRSGGRKQYPAPVHAEPWLRHWVPIVQQQPATVIQEQERWDSARTILKAHQQDVMMQWYKEARRRMEAYYSRWYGRISGGGGGGGGRSRSQEYQYLSVETYETEPRMVGLLRFELEVEIEDSATASLELVLGVLPPLFKNKIWSSDAASCFGRLISVFGA